MSTSSNFKVIVVGGGPVGLTAAHALTQAGIDFVLLERRQEVVIDAGSNLVLSPVGLRTLAQLGIQKEIYAVSSPLSRVDRIDHNGKNIGDVEFFKQMEKNTGIALRVISRHDLTKVLFDTLPSASRAKLFGGKKLLDIATTSDGVVASCEDGSTYSANAVIGADGAHSLVRNLMRLRAIESGSAEVNEEQPFLTTYRGLWIRFPKQAGLSAGMTCETHGHNAATQLFVGEESGVMGLYDRLEHPTKDRIRHTKEDQDALIQRWAQMPVTPDAKITLRDVYESRLESGLVSLEEGVVDHWSFDGRIVLVGDAAHKFTPSTGAGCNNGMIDIVVLVNQLHSTLQKTAGACPSKAEVATAFKAYQDLRYESVVDACAQSGQQTVLATWQTGIHRFLDRQIFSRHVVQRFLINSGAEKLAATPTLDFVTCKLESNGRVPWKNSTLQTAVAT
jgi:2-polyprenyl-6-methoxyphenol hydroxylase-like FAD-dependent oxidoreductase